MAAGSRARGTAASRQLQTSLPAPVVDRSTGIDDDKAVNLEQLSPIQRRHSADDLDWWHRDARSFESTRELAQAVSAVEAENRVREVEMGALLASNAMWVRDEDLDEVISECDFSSVPEAHRKPLLLAIARVAIAERRLQELERAAEDLVDKATRELDAAAQAEGLDEGARVAAFEAAIGKGAAVNYELPTRKLDDGTLAHWKTFLMVMAEDGKLEAARCLLAHGALVNTTCDQDVGRRGFDGISGFDALKYATIHGHIEMAKLLLENGARPNQDEGVLIITTLMVSVKNAMSAASDDAHGSQEAEQKYQKALQMVRLLLEHGAQPDAHSKGYPPLSLAAETDCHELVQLLISHGADPNLVTKGSAPIVSAANIHVARVLLESGADPNFATVDDERDQDGHTALIYAAQLGNVEVMKLLIAYGAKVNHVTSEGRAALNDAARGNCIGAMRVLLQHGACPDAAIDARSQAVRDGKDTLYLQTNWTAAMDASEPWLGSQDGEPLSCLQLLAAYGADLELTSTWDEDTVNSDDEEIIVENKESVCKTVIAAPYRFPLTIPWLQATLLQGNDGRDLWTPFEIAVSCRLASDIRAALKLGNINPSGSSLATVARISSAAAGSLWRESPVPCAETTRQAREAMRSWAPCRHFLYHVGFRARIFTMLLVELRLRGRAESMSAVRRSTRLLHVPLLSALPSEIWTIVCGFLTREDFRAESIELSLCSSFVIDMVNFDLPKILSEIRWAAVNNPTVLSAAVHGEGPLDSALGRLHKLTVWTRRFEVLCATAKSDLQWYD